MTFTTGEIIGRSFKGKENLLDQGNFSCWTILMIKSQGIATGSLAVQQTKFSMCWRIIFAIGPIFPMKLWKSCRRRCCRRLSAEKDCGVDSSG